MLVVEYLYYKRVVFARILVWVSDCPHHCIPLATHMYLITVL